MSKGLTIDIPKDVVEGVKLPPDEVEQQLRTELALALYARGIVTGGVAARLAEVTRHEFEELLGKRRIRRHYDDDDLADDIAYARRSQ